MLRSQRKITLCFEFPISSHLAIRLKFLLPQPIPVFALLRAQTSRTSSEVDQLCNENVDTILLKCLHHQVIVSLLFATGFRNTSSQIAASFTQDGKYVISASEDSHVYVWKREVPRNSNVAKAKALVTSKSYEHFPCRDVSVAIPWPGTIRGDPPAMPIHSKRYSKRSTLTQPSASNGSPAQEDQSLLQGNSKRLMLPPLPKKAIPTEQASIPPEVDLALLSRLDSGFGSGIGESFNSDASSARYDESPLISVAVNSSSASWSSSWSWFDSSNSNGANAMQATAWGMVIVTAGLRGEIRAYQNFGLPRRVGRQANLF